MTRSEIMHFDRPAIGPDAEAQLRAAMKACKLLCPTRIAFIGNYLPRECGIATFNNRPVHFD